MAHYEVHRLFEDDPDGCCKRVAQLETFDEDGASRSPLRDFGKKKGNREAANNLLDVIEQIEKIGVAVAIKIGRVKHLSGSMYEIKFGDATARAYCHGSGADAMLVIVGIEGETHKGGSNNSNKFMEKYKGKIAIVEGLLSAKEEYHDK